MMGRGAASLAASAAALLVCGCALSACTQADPPKPSPSGHAQAPAAGVDAESRDTPSRALFDRTNERTAAASSPTGADFISALEAAGFRRGSLEVTADVTSARLAAPSIQFSARVGDSCLIGQYGPDGSSYRSVLAAPITTGDCLIGTQKRP